MLPRTDNTIKCIEFISINKEFFVALMSMPTILASIVGDENIEKSRLLAAMNKAFKNNKGNRSTTARSGFSSFNKFKTCICGNVQNGINGLANGDSSLLHTYLANNPQMVEAILSNTHDSIIEKWREKNCDDQVFSVSIPCRKYVARDIRKTNSKRVNDDEYAGLVSHSLFAVGCIILAAGAAVSADMMFDLKIQL